MYETSNNKDGHTRTNTDSFLVIRVQPMYNVK